MEMKREGEEAPVERPLKEGGRRHTGAAAPRGHGGGTVLYPVCVCVCARPREGARVISH